MATAPQTNPQPQIVHHLGKKTIQIIPTKSAFMGEQGSGKSTTAGLYSAALSVLHHNRAPVWVTDPELSWQFLDPVIFKTEGVKLVQRTVPTFAAMLKDLRDAEREGACVWNVELGKIWIEIVRTLQKKSPATWGMELRHMWDDFVAHFLNSKLHCIALGRIQDIVEQVITEQGELKSIKSGEGMKAGGQANNFGYEPHFVVRMYREQRPRVKKGKTFEEEGRVVHRAQVTKDRTWALNGKVFRWTDRDSYQKGDFKYVYQSLEPHFTAVQKTMAFVTLDTLATSEELIDDDGNGEFYAMRQRKETISAEIKASLDLYFAGRGKEEVQVRIAVNELIFGVKSREAAEALSLDKLERGLRILHAYEKFPTHNLDTKEAVLKQVAEAVKEYDLGQNEEWEVPF